MFLPKVVFETLPIILIFLSFLFISIIKWQGLNIFSEIVLQKKQFNNVRLSSYNFSFHNVLLSLISIFSISLLFFYTQTTYFQSSNQIEWNILVAIAATLFSFLITFISGELLLSRSARKEVLSIKFIYFQILGVSIISLLLAIELFPSIREKITLPLVFIATICIYVIYLYQLCLIIGRDFSVFHLFVYLCTLEIIPILYCIKYLWA